MPSTHRTSTIAYAGFWMLGALLMAWSYRSNPVDPSLTGTAAYGTTRAGELRFLLGVTAVEAVALAAILRPWSYARSWARALVALLVLTPWLLYWGAVGMHAGPATHVHTGWLLVHWVGLAVAFLVSGIAAGRARAARR